MATPLERTPVDEELTGLPLPVLMRGTDFSFNGFNYHHHFHPRRSLELGYDPEAGSLFPIDDDRRVAGQAVRSSRGQQIPVWLHERYHQVFSGPPLPQTEREQFVSAVLACAGIVPGEAIDLYTRGEARIVELSANEHEFIRRRIFFQGADHGPGRSRRYTIGRFLARYTLDNSLEEVVSAAEVWQRVGELLRPRSEEQRREAARFIMTQAVDASVADIIPIHQEAKSARLVRHPRRSLIDVVLRFLPDDRYPDYYEVLTERVRALAA